MKKPKSLTIADLAGAEVTAGVVAALLGLSERRSRQLAERGILRRTERGAFVLTDAVGGYAAFLKHGAEAATAGPSGEDYAAARARRESAQASLAELELAKARGEVALVAEFEQAWDRAFAEIRTAVYDNLPRRAARRLVGLTSEREIVDVLRDEARHALEGAATAPVADDDDGANDPLAALAGELAGED